jgi:hypothetical protein
MLEEELTCARKIVSTLARRAYRRPVDAADIDSLVALYQSERKNGSFDSGIELVLNRVLADPEFIFRFERDHGCGAGSIIESASLN